MSGVPPEIDRMLRKCAPLMKGDPFPAPHPGMTLEDVGQLVTPDDPRFMEEGILPDGRNPAVHAKKMAVGEYCWWWGGMGSSVIVRKTANGLYYLGLYNLQYDDAESETIRNAVTFATGATMTTVAELQPPEL